MMFIILYVPDLSLLNLSLLMFFLGLFYSVQSLVFAVGRELSPNEAAGTAIAMTNMIVMIGAMFLQPLVGRIMDWSLRRRESLGIIPGDGLSVDRIQQLYTASDYQLALSLIPLGILIAIILTFFLRETHVHVSK
jgi:MFS family permease